MKTEMMNLCIFVGIGFMVFLIFRNLNFENLNFREGMKNASENKMSNTNENGIAGNASSYAANIKTQVIQLQDTMLLSKYRSDYETAILNLDDLVNNLMLKTALNIDQTNPQKSLILLSQLQQSKAGLNSIMKFIDSNK